MGRRAAQSIAAFLPAVADDTLADVREGDPPADAHTATLALDDGTVTIALRRLD